MESYTLFRGWAVRIHKVETGKEDAEFCMPVFALVFTKFKKSPNLPQVIATSYLPSYR